MTEKTKNNYPPSLFLQKIFRVPVYLYKWGLGWMFGKRFVSFEHIGRKSGKHYQSVVEVVEIEKETGNVIVVAGYGNQAQWYKNLKQMSTTSIQLGSKKLTAKVEMISPEDGADIMLRYTNRYGKLTGMLFSMMGYDWDGTEQGTRKIAIDHLRFVRFAL